MEASLRSRRIRQDRVFDPADRRKRPYWNRLSRWPEVKTLNEALFIARPWSDIVVYVNRADWDSLHQALDELRKYDS